MPASFAFWICSGLGGTYESDQGGRPLHVVLHLVLLVLDDLLLEPSAPAAAAAPALRGLGLRLVDREFRELTVGAVVDALLLARLLLALEAEDGRLDPLVLAETFLAFGQVLLQGGKHLIRGGRGLRGGAHRQIRGHDPDRDRREGGHCAVHLHEVPLPSCHRDPESLVRSSDGVVRTSQGKERASRLVGKTSREAHLFHGFQADRRLRYLTSLDSITTGRGEATGRGEGLPSPSAVARRLGMS